MIKKKRLAMFETNSSSSHAIFISQRPEEEPYEFNGKTVTIEQGEYGWEVDELRDWAEKASYALTWASNYGSKSDVEMLRRVIIRGTGAAKVAFVGEGYIDHQSVEVCARVFEDEWGLYSFLFCPRSFVELGNDNM